MRSTEANCSDEFFVLDADRCLVNTDATVDRLVEVLGDNGEAKFADRLFVDIKEKRSAASVHQQLETTLGLDRTLNIYQQFAQVDENESYSLRGEGADDLLGFLEDNAIRKGILTYGDKPWQLAKLKAAGYDDIPTMVTAEKRKGKTIRSWRRHYDKYWVPEELAVSGSEMAGVMGGKVLFATIVFADDKPESFEEFPAEDARGYIVNPKVEGSPIGNIRVVNDLREVQRIEESRLSI